MMILKIKRVFISRGEMIESMELYDQGKLKNYIYAYKVLKGAKWITLVRWDNVESMDHMDIYDENGTLINQVEMEKKRFEDVVKIVRTFRRSIIAVDISNL